MAFDTENNGYIFGQADTQRIGEPREAVAEPGAYGVNYVAPWEQNSQASQQAALNRFACWGEKPIKDSDFVVWVFITQQFISFAQQTP